MVLKCPYGSHKKVKTYIMAIAKKGYMYFVLHKYVFGTLHIMAIVRTL